MSRFLLEERSRIFLLDIIPVISGMILLLKGKMEKSRKRLEICDLVFDVVVDLGWEVLCELV
jgi:hypothetical protein